MKTKSSLILLFIGLFSLSLTAKDGNKTTTYRPFEMTPEVKAIVENKCYGCHNTESQNDKGKEKLDFDKMDELSKLKKISSYKEIAEVVEENEMPPSRFLERYPDKKLTEEERKAIMDWANKEAENLVKGM